MVDDIEHETISNRITNTSCDYAGAANNNNNKKQTNKNLQNRSKNNCNMAWQLGCIVRLEYIARPTRKEHRLQCSSVGSYRRIEQFDFVIHAMDDDCVRLRHCLRHHRLVIGIRHQHIAERMHRGLVLHVTPTLLCRRTATNP